MNKIMQSPFSLIFGFLSSLVFNEFIKKASVSLFLTSSIEVMLLKIIVICLGGFWIFYTIYSTVSWLMFTEYNPNEAGLPNSFPKMIFLRFLEFLPFICLYGIVNVMGPTEIKSSSKVEIIPGIAEGVRAIDLNRLSIEIGSILILWAIWNFVWWFVPPRPKFNNLRKNKPRKIGGLCISGFIFILIYPLLNLSIEIGIFLLFILTTIYLLFDILMLNQMQYTLLTKFLSLVIDKSASRDSE